MKTNTGVTLFAEDELGDIEYQKMIIAMANSSDPKTRKKGEELVIKQFDKYLFSIINDLYPQYLNQENGDDLMQECRIGLLQYIKDYDPDKGAPSVFLRDRIKYNARLYASEKIEGVKINKKKQKNKVDKARERLIAEGIKEPTLLDISYAAKLRPAVVKGLLEDQFTIIPTGIDDYKVVDVNSTDPEKAAIESEFTQIVRSVIATFSPLEQLCFKSQFGYTCEKKSITQIAEVAGVKVSEVNKAKKSAILKFKKNPMLISYIKSNHEYILQSDEESISCIPQFESDMIMDQLSIADFDSDDITVYDMI